MALPRNLLSRRLLLNHTHSSSLKTPPFPLRPITTTSSPQTRDDPVTPNSQNHKNKKPLHSLFMESVVLNQKIKATPQEQDEESEENSELKKNLRQIEKEVRRSLNEGGKGKKKKQDAVSGTKRRSLFAVFTNQPYDDDGGNAKEVRLLRKPMVLKELSPDMEVFLEFMFRNGYFKDANFAKGKENFDLGWFNNFFARGYIKFAAQRFGSDNQEIAKWLSGSALKQVALFGCPSNDKGSVFPAKRLRKFFEVPENTVCSKCALLQSCKFANQSVWKGNDIKTLHLDLVMKLVVSYALELVHPQLVVPDEVKKSVSQLLKEIVKLSHTT